MLADSFSRPSAWRIRRVVSAVVSWLASFWRSAPVKRESRNSWPQLKVKARVSNSGRSRWSRYGVFR